MWSQSGSAIAKCESAYGSGLGCIKSGSSHSSYAVVTSTMSKPAGYSTPTTMAGDLSAGFTSVSPIPTPYVDFALPPVSETEQTTFPEQSLPRSIRVLLRSQHWPRTGRFFALKRLDQITKKSCIIKWRGKLPDNLNQSWSHNDIQCTWFNCHWRSPVGALWVVSHQAVADYLPQKSTDNAGARDGPEQRRVRPERALTRIPT